MAGGRSARFSIAGITVVLTNAREHGRAGISAGREVFPHELAQRSEAPVELPAPRGVLINLTLGTHVRQRQLQPTRSVEDNFRYRRAASAGIRIVSTPNTVRRPFAIGPRVLADKTPHRQRSLTPAEPVNRNESSWALAHPRSMKIGTR